MISFDDTPHVGDFFVSSDPVFLDFGWLEANLLKQEWATTWTPERLRLALNVSRCFGVYLQPPAEPGAVRGKPAMVGFARAITDGFTYSMVCDVVIDPAFENRGLAKFLMSAVVTNPAVRGTVSILRTSNEKARHIYEKFGYTEVPAMRRIPK